MLWDHLPEGAVLYAANSMPIREIDAYAGPQSKTARVLANRGVNGIDGQVSAALGAAAATARPTVLWCGDLAFLHDVGGLVAGRQQDCDLTVVVSNDDGGGIFEYLPVARAVPREVFERVFAVPHGTDLCAVARGFGWNATRTTTAEAFLRAISHATAGGRHLIEVPVDRASNTAFHRTLDDAVRAALQRELPA
jgi:2-succinyl-5-enolpyruvyl-6-hydroxy-3-cyclohexene-1-carboxylate synthase